MQIQLFVCKDDPKKLNKSLSSAITMTGNLKDESSVITPTVLIETNPTNFNYAYIAEFDRYYFIENVNVVRGSLFELQLRVDVLFSNRNAISSMSGILEKTSNYNMDLYINDSTFRFESRTTNEVKQFPYGFNENPDYILITAGGIV